jgi:hypothetical protein
MELTSDDVAAFIYVPITLCDVAVGQYKALGRQHILKYKAFLYPIPF